MTTKTNRSSELTMDELSGIAGGDTPTKQKTQSQYPTESVTFNFTAIEIKYSE